ncbi:DUF4339 domain-containing protein [Roseibacillus persicicus]|uniref:DUF4339 domain-containing protein n=1 Tax=Roseibacillus persicicus TaxID=454148 RepID=UPI00398A808C
MANSSIQHYLKLSCHRPHFPDTALREMNSWFYAHSGEQKGPVSEEELARLAASGDFNPTKDLVWREGMTDWKKVAEVPELNLTRSNNPTPPNEAANQPAARPTSSHDPYQAPVASSYPTPENSGDDLPEIEPGSSPLGITECIDRAFTLTKKHFGILVAVWVIYFAISFGLGMVLGVIEAFAGGGANQPDFSSGSSTFPGQQTGPSTGGALAVSAVTNLISRVVSIFLTLGITRFGLNFISGKPAEIGMMFGEGSKLLRAFGASILYWLMVAAGSILLIVPGVYLALRFGQYQHAIVDRNMGVFEAFRYSSSITQNNKMNLLGLGVLLFLINVAGAVALCVGLLFTVPLTWLAWLLAYRWLQHGPPALQSRGLLKDQFGG